MGAAAGSRRVYYYATVPASGLTERDVSRKLIKLLKAIKCLKVRVILPPPPPRTTVGLRTAGCRTAADTDRIHATTSGVYVSVIVIVIIIISTYYCTRELIILLHYALLLVAGHTYTLASRNEIISKTDDDRFRFFIFR